MHKINKGIASLLLLTAVGVTIFVGSAEAKNNKGAGHSNQKFSIPQNIISRIVSVSKNNSKFEDKIAKRQDKCLSKKASYIARGKGLCKDWRTNEHGEHGDEQGDGHGDDGVISRPSITQLSPSSVVTGSGDFTLVVSGTNFSTSSVVRWNGSDRVTTYISPTQISAIIRSTDVVAQTTAQISVFDPNGLSNQKNFSVFQISSGTLSFGLDASSPSSGVLPGSTGVVLAKYFARPTGQDMELRQIRLTIDNSASILTDSVTVRVNGASVWSGAPSLFPSGTTQALTLSTFPVLSAGQNSYITVESNVANGAANGGSVQVYLDLLQVRRLSTNDILDPDTNNVSANLITVQAGSLAVTTLTGTNYAPASEQNVIVNSSAVPVFAFQLNTQAEPLKIVKIKLTASGKITSAGDLLNLRLYRDNDINSFASANQMIISGGELTYTFTAADNLLLSPVVPGSPVTIYVKADIGPANVAILGDNFHFRLSSPSDISARGVNSGNTVEPSAISGSTTATSNIVPFLVSLSADFPTFNQTQTITTDSVLARLKIQNTGTGAVKITLANLKFVDNGSHAGSTTTYKLLYSSQNFTDYSGYTAGTSSPSVNFGALTPGVTIDAGAFRYFTVAIDNPGSAKSGDTWQLSVASLGDVTYTVSESDFGFDLNNNGTMTDVIGPLFTNGKPGFATLIKQ